MELFMLLLWKSYFGEYTQEKRIFWFANLIKMGKSLYPNVEITV
jgi:hypothetical protein